MDDRALCKSCYKEYENTKLVNCSLCSELLCRCSCSSEYLEKHSVKRIVKLFRYALPSESNERIPANELIYNIKRVKRKDLIDLISDEIIVAIKNSIDYKDCLITNVPRKRDRVLSYGLDHSREIAKAISKKLDIEYISVLKSKSKNPQKKMHGEQRLKNARFDYIKRPNLKGKRVLLVDDIVTTGASMGHSALLIRGLGAKEVIGACMAIAYKDKYKPFVNSFSPW